MIPFRADGIPSDLRERPQWLAWLRKEADGKDTKVPVVAGEAPTGYASTTDPTTWRSFEDALVALRWADGLGFVFTSDDDFLGVDLDDCVDGDAVHPAALKLIESLGGYVELSPSGRGIHVIVRGSLNGHPRNRTKDTAWGGLFEAYDSRRFFTITGHPPPRLRGSVNGVGRSDRLHDVLEEAFGTPAPLPAPAPCTSVLSDTEILDRVARASNSAKFERLWRGDTSGYDSESEADLALLGIFAFWTQDPAQLDSLFRRSGLHRDKWQRADYRERTIARALSGGEVYTGPPRARNGEAEPPALAASTAERNGTPYAPGSRLPFQSLHEMLENVPSAPPWIWEPFLAQGAATQTVGPPKGGKSTLVFGLLAARERGEQEFLGSPLVPGGSALLLTEEGVYTLRDKQFVLGLVGRRIDALRREQVIGWPWPEVCAQAIERCQEQGHDLLIIDTISSWCGLTGEKENHSGAITEALEPLRAATEAGVCVWLVHHARKGGGRHGESARGSSQFQAAVDVFMEVQHLTDEDHGPRSLKVRTRFGGEPDTLGVQYADGSFDVTTNVESLKISDAQQGIVDLLSDGRPRSAREVGDATERTAEGARQLLHKLERHGVVMRTGAGTSGSPHTYTLREVS